jgi:hypothetical protein
MYRISMSALQMGFQNHLGTLKQPAWFWRENVLALQASLLGRFPGMAGNEQQ